MRKLTALTIALGLSAAGQAFAGPPHAPQATLAAGGSHAAERVDVAAKRVANHAETIKGDHKSDGQSSRPPAGSTHESDLGLATETIQRRVALDKAAYGGERAIVDAPPPENFRERALNR